MKKIIEVIAKALVSNPEQVVVTEKNDSNIIVYELACSFRRYGRLLVNKAVLQKRYELLLKQQQLLKIKKLLLK